MDKMNLEIIKEEVKKQGFTIGILDGDIALLNENALKKVLNSLNEEYTDLFISINKKLFVVEIATVDLEKDIIMYDDYGYFSKYGNLDEALDMETITKKQYDSLKRRGL